MNDKVPAEPSAPAPIKSMRAVEFLLKAVALGDPRGNKFTPAVLLEIGGTFETVEGAMRVSRSLQEELAEVISKYQAEALAALIAAPKGERH